MAQENLVFIAVRYHGLDVFQMQFVFFRPSDVVVRDSDSSRSHFQMKLEVREYMFVGQHHPDVRKGHGSQGRLQNGHACLLLIFVTNCRH